MGVSEISAEEWARLKAERKVRSIKGPDNRQHYRVSGWRHADGTAQVLELVEVQQDGTVVVRVVD